MAADKNQPNKAQADQQATEQVSNPNTTQHRPDWIIPDREAGTSNSNNKEDQQHNQQDGTSSSMGNDETLGIP